MSEISNTNVQSRDNKPDRVDQTELAEVSTPENSTDAAKATSSGETGKDELVTYAAVQPGIPVDSSNVIDADKIKFILPESDGEPVELPIGMQLAKIDTYDNHLVLEDKDGSLIIILNGAKNPPTILLGTQEISSEVLLASLGSGVPVVPAAGSNTGQGPESSGQNFEVPPGHVGDTLNANPLLPPTEFDRAFISPEEFAGLLSQNDLEDPAEPLEPETPTEPVKPSEPTEPAEPIEPSVPLQIVSVTPSQPSVSDNGLSDDGIDVDQTVITIKAGTSIVTDLRFGDDLTGIKLAGADPSVDIVWNIVPGSGNTILEGSTPSGDVVVRLEIGLDGPVPAGESGTGTVTITLLDGFPHEPGSSDVAVISDIPIVAEDADGNTDPAMFDVDVLDSVPVAVNDAHTIGWDEFGPVSGNLITDAEANGDNGADQIGADDGTITGVDPQIVGISSDNLGGSLAPIGNGAVTTTGQYGEVTVHPDGGYSYTRNAGTPDGVKDVFTYVLRDGDSDTDTATLTIDVVSDPNPVVDDLTPSVQGGNVTVDEDGLAAANLDGSPLRSGETDSTELATATGQMSVDFKSLAEVPGSLIDAIALLDTAGLDGQLQTVGLVDVNFSLAGNVLVGLPQSGGAPVIAIEITSVISSVGPLVTYGYTVTLFEAVNHLVDGSEDTVTLNDVMFKVTDANGSTVDGTFDVAVTDDLAILTVEANQDAANKLLSSELDETVGDDRANPANGELADGNSDDLGPGLAQVTTIVSGGLATLFSVGGGFGADGAGTVTGSLSFTGLTAGGVATSLSATDGGSITLQLINTGLIEGYDTDGHTVLSIAIVGGPGAEQLQTTLYEAIHHGDNGAAAADKFDESLPLLLAQAGTIGLEYQVTRVDGDGDTVVASDTIELISGTSSLFSFDDDGPTLSVTSDDVIAARLLASELDETEGADRANPANGETADGNTDDAGPGLAQVSTDVAGGLVKLFSISGDFGTDGATSDTGALSFAGLTAGGAGAATSLSATNGGLITLYLTAGGVLEGRDADSDVVFSIAIVGGPGAEQLQTTLFEAIDHKDDGSATLDKFDESLPLLLAQAGTIGLQYQVIRTDGDGDTVVASDTIELFSHTSSVLSFSDDGPAAVVGTTSLTVHEDALNNLGDLNPFIDGSKGNQESGQVTTVSLSFAALMTLVDFGSDGFASFALADAATIDGTAVKVSGGGSQVTSQGETVVYDHVSSTQIDAVSSVDGRIVFSLELDAGNSRFDVTLHDQVDHLSGLGDSAELGIDISPAILAEDLDSDTLQLVNAVTLNIENDVPVVYAPEAGYLVNNGTGAAMFSLDWTGKVGADGSGNVTFSNVTNGVTTLTDSAGGAVTASSQTVYLFVSADGHTLVGSTDAGFAIGTFNAAIPDASVVMFVSLNPDDVTVANDVYEVTMLQTLDNGAGVFFNNLSGGQAGNPPFKIIESTTADSLEMLFTPIGETSVNSDANDAAVGSQFIGIANPDKGLRIDFGDFSFHANGGGSSNDGFTISQHSKVNGFRFSVDQISNGSTVDIKLNAIDANEGTANQSPINGSAPGGQHNFGDDPLVTITAVTIFDNLGVVVGTATGDTSFGSIGVDFQPDGSVVVSDLLEQYSVKTTTLNGYDRLEVLNAGTNGGTDGKFSISELQVESVRTGDPIELSFDVEGSDADGDTISGDVSLTLLPDAAQSIVGTSAGEIIAGTSDDDFISGLAGIDTISGGDGADILAGGLGSDTLTGGNGADTFLMHSIDEATDSITDYVIGDGDMVDLTDLFAVDTTDVSGVANEVGDFVEASGNQLLLDADGDDGGDGVADAGEQVVIATLDTFGGVNILYTDETGEQGPVVI